MSGALVVAAEVAAALAENAPVVGLESTLLAHGLPQSEGYRVGLEIEQAVRAEGAVPATIAVLDGTVRVGLSEAELRRVTAGDLAKLSVRDLPVAVAAGRPGATTVAATVAVAAAVGIGVVATGGLGGVHRGAAESYDESADLPVLAGTPVVLVCSGVKSILDVGATLERLETLSVTVLGFGTDRFPGFYLTDSGYPVPWRVDSAEEVAAVAAARDRLGLARAAVVVANPLSTDEQLDPAVHDRVLSDALAHASASGVRGGHLTPYLLDRFHRETGGASLAANVRLVLRNARLAAGVAGAMSRRPAQPGSLPVGHRKSTIF